MKMTTVFNQIISEATTDIKPAVEKYLDKIRAATDKEWQRNEYTFPQPIFTASFGPSWIRIESVTYGGKGQRSVHCFVNGAGDIFKAAGWKAPAKGKRGSIHDANPPVLGQDFYR